MLTSLDIGGIKRERSDESADIQSQHRRKDARAKLDFRVPSRVMTDHDTAATGTIDPAVEQAQREAVVSEAVSVIDEALTKMMQRELVSSGEVADLLLDVRMLLTR